MLVNKATVSKPTDESQGGNLCPTGHYCQQDTDNPLPCEAGTFQLNQGESSCDVCTSGYYCTSNTTDPTNYICPIGHYCPAGTAYSTQYPCPKGTFSSTTGLNNSISCIAGQYCQGVGLSQPDHYCSAGSFKEIAACTKGHYCPGNSTEPQLCPGGKYCATW